MNKRKPNVIAVDTTEKESTLTLHVSGDITDFKGHFKR
ncbi:3-hydroxyacyl-ACP dehydratase, partial [Vibrio sp. 10N.222.55.E8]